MAYRVKLDEWGRAPTGLITKRDRMIAATFGFDAEGAAKAPAATSGPRFYAVAVRQADIATGQQGEFVSLGIVRVDPQ